MIRSRIFFPFFFFFKLRKERNKDHVGRTRGKKGYMNGVEILHRQTKLAVFENFGYLIGVS